MFLCSVTMDDITDDITQPTNDVQNVEVPTGIIFSFFQCYNNPFCCSWNAWFNVLHTCWIYLSKIPKT